MASLTQNNLLLIGQTQPSGLDETTVNTMVISKKGVTGITEGISRANLPALRDGDEITAVIEYQQAASVQINAVGAIEAAVNLTVFSKQGVTGLTAAIARAGLPALGDGDKITAWIKYHRPAPETLGGSRFDGHKDWIHDSPEPVDPASPFAQFSNRKPQTSFKTLAQSPTFTAFQEVMKKMEDHVAELGERSQDEARPLKERMEATKKMAGLVANLEAKVTRLKQADQDKAKESTVAVAKRAATPFALQSSVGPRSPSPILGDQSKTPGTLKRSRDTDDSDSDSDKEWRRKGAPGGKVKKSPRRWARKEF